MKNLSDKKRTYCRHRKLKQGLSYGLVFKKLHKVIKFSQNALLK